jgi:hypothetical protein
VPESSFLGCKVWFGAVALFGCYEFEKQEEGNALWIVGLIKTKQSGF